MPVYELQNRRADIIAPGLAAENTVMPGIRSHVMLFHVVAQQRQQIQSRQTLPRGRNIITPAFDDLDSGVANFGDIHQRVKEWDGLRDIFVEVQGHLFDVIRGREEIEALK